MEKKRRFIITFIKGLIIGGTMTVPGVSGGTMAMILGIYNRLIEAVSNLFKEFKKNLLFLVTVAVGGGIGMIVFANSLLVLIEKHPMPMKYFFIGAVAGGIPLIANQAQIRKISWKILIYPLIGIVMVYSISLLPEGLFVSGGALGLRNIIVQFLGGFIVAIALILPGISVSHMLLMMGMYEGIMLAVSQFQFLSLIPLVIGVAVCTLLSTKLIDAAMNKYPQPTYLIILGFIFASIPEIYPGIPVGREVVLSVATAAAGFAFVYMISKKEQS